MRAWYESVKAYVWMLRPKNQTKALRASWQNGYEEGVNDGIEGVCKRLANVNRQTRRRVVRDIVKQYKDEERKPA